MGLGKTVEVLALILFHTRQGLENTAPCLPEVSCYPEPLTSVSLEPSQATGSRSVDLLRRQNCLNGFVKQRY